jgi:hypothetical protein
MNRHLAFLVAATVCFCLAALKVPSPIDLKAVGLALLCIALM